MAHPLEVEIKLVATPAMLESLRRHPQLAGEERTATLVTTYFDTPGGRLRRGGAALRIRDDGDQREQSLKLAGSSGGRIRRGEWNLPLAGDCPQPADFPARPGSALARLLAGEPLEPVATTRIARTTRRLHCGSSAVEIAFDVGSIVAGGREEAVCELELELVEGRLADVIALALALPVGPELAWSVSSKAQRCHALAYGLPPAAVQAQRVGLSPAMDVAQGFRAIAWNCLEQVLANYPLVIASGDAEAVHQARVALRRLRVAGSLFADQTGDRAGPVLRAELEAVAKGLGPARDLDVLCARVAAARRGDDGLNEMLDHLAGRRAAALAAARDLLATEAFQRLLFEFAAWLEAGDWLSRKAETGGNRPLLPFARRVLSQRRRKLKRQDGRLADLPDAARHRLRIQAKKLRYAATFFASLFPDRKTAGQRVPFIRALARLQDSLGELNDLAVASAGRDELFADLGVIAAARQAAQMEGLLAAEAKSARTLMRRAERSLAEIAGSPAWWKSA